MLTKAQNKYIRSLTQQKFRNENKVFVAEGEKIALEWLSSRSNINMIIATEHWVAQHKAVIATHKEATVHAVKEWELEGITGLQTANDVILVLPLPQRGNVPAIDEWCIALDDIQDPGNMGTIVRIADWFGIHHIVCSPGCVDVYNPKVVQSAMGGHLRVGLYETELAPFLSATKLPKLAATLDGDSVYAIKREKKGVLIIGNESRGISAEVAATATKKISIPRRGGAESLNAGVSAGILCALLLPC
jgi:TrmH family RNA methyltransferase